MPTALENSSHNASNEITNVDSEISNTKGSPQAAARIVSLLVSDPIDLAGIGNEIRNNPSLESLVLRLGVSLALSPDEALNTVEEAVIVLGTSRLRVLIDLWSSADSSSSDQTKEQGRAPQNNSQDESSLVATPEARYLTNFLRCLGCECSENALSGRRLEAWTSKIRHDQIVALTDLFMRDFFSLLPAIQPGFAELAAPFAKHHPLRS